MADLPPQPPGESPEENDGPGGPKQSLSRLPLKALVFWLLIIFALPFGLFMMKWDQAK